MVVAALEALVGGEPGDEAVATALATIPAAELPDALRLLARQYRLAAVPILRRCLRGRPEWAAAAAQALGTLPLPEAAAALAAAEAGAPPKAVRTAVRRALYRLRQAGVTPPPPPAAARPAPAPPEPRQAWASAIDGTGSRGLWLVLESRAGERTLLSAILNETGGVLEFAGGPIAKKRLDARLQALRAESAFPWAPLPPAWAAALLVEATARHAASGTPLPADLARWLLALPAAEPGDPPIYGRFGRETVAADPTALERSAELLALPELGGWFLDPASVQTEALERLQAKESRLVVSDQIKAERLGALVDRVIDREFTGETRRHWQRRLEEEAWVLAEIGHEAEARLAVAVALTLADVERPARRIPFLRALVERSLEIAGEVALGRVPGEEVSRLPRAPRAATSAR